MPKARPFDETADALDLQSPVGFGDLCLFSMPLETFKALTDEAARRGMTLAQLVQKAFTDVLSESRGLPLPAPRGSHG